MPPYTGAKIILGKNFIDNFCFAKKDDKKMLIPVIYQQHVNGQSLLLLVSHVEKDIATAITDFDGLPSR